MFELIIFIIIIYCAACSKKVPPGKEAIVRRNNEIYKTYRAYESFIINPFTDTVEYVSKKNGTSRQQSSGYPNVNYINPMNTSRHNSSSVQHQKGYKTFTLNNMFTFKSLDNKTLSVKVYALFNASTNETIHSTVLLNSVKKEVVDYYSGLKAEDISTSATRHELTLFDILRRTISTETVKLIKFEATPSNARITTRNTTDKADCTHYDEPSVQARKSNYSYSQGNAIKSSLSDTWQELNGNPISSDDGTSNPIKETISIHSVLGKNMIDINNMDSNVDPIDNKM